MAITPLPTPPSRDDPTNFATRADAFLGALPDFATEANALAVDVNEDAGIASAAADAAAQTLDAPQWVSGTTYAQGVAVWSPITYVTYRRKIAGAGTTDPSADPTNWEQVNRTITNAQFKNGYSEDIFAISGTTPALSPSNASIQTWTLSGNSTPTAGTWLTGQSITLMIDDGSARTITWTSLPVTWKTDFGTAPTLETSGITAIALWKVGTTIYGARVGNA